MKTYGKKQKLFECTIRFVRKKPVIVRVHAVDQDEAMSLIPDKEFGLRGWLDIEDVKEVK